MIQDIAPWRFGNEFLSASPSDDDNVLDVTAEGLLLRKNGLRVPTVREWRAMNESAGLVYAFRLTRREESEQSDAPMTERACAEGREARFFLALRQGDDAPAAPSLWQRTPPSELRAQAAPLPLAAATAQHLAHWYATHRFCGRCGGPVHPSSKERALECPACGEVIYPVIAPCILAAVTNGDKLLLTRYARPGATRLVLVAGFVETGETAEQAAAREVMEETGLRIRNLRYAGSQPWGFSGTLAVGFFAELDGPEDIRLDTSELAEARWVKRADIPPCPDDSSLTMNMISRFARGEV